MKESIPGQDFPDRDELRALARHPVTRELNARLLQAHDEYVAGPARWKAMSASEQEAWKAQYDTAEEICFELFRQFKIGAGFAGYLSIKEEVACRAHRP